MENEAKNEELRMFWV